MANPATRRIHKFPATAGLLVGLASLAILTLVIASLIRAGSDADEVDGYDLAEARRGNLYKQLNVTATVYPADPVIVLNECYWWPIEILELVPEGTKVKKGDVVCRLDQTDPEKLMLERKLKLIRAREKFAIAQATSARQETLNQRRQEKAFLEKLTAQEQLRSYTGAEFENSLTEARRESELAAEQVDQAVDQFEYTRQLAQRGIRNWDAVRQAGYGVSRAARQLDLGHISINLLEKYDHQRQLTSLTSNARLAAGEIYRTDLTCDLATTIARVNTLESQKTLAVLEEEYERIANSVAACTVVAPCDGEVVHSNTQHSISTNDRYIEIGKKVHYRQEILGLVDRRNLKLSGRIRDRVAYQVQAGQQVEFRMSRHGDAFRGKVTWISPMSSRDDRFTSTRSHFIEIRPDADTPVELFAPMTEMDCRILLDTRLDVIHIPADSLVEFEERMIVLVRRGSELQITPVEPGLLTDRRVEIVNGLNAGDQVVTGPAETLRALAASLTQ